MSGQFQRLSLHAPTIAAIAAVVWSVFAVLHEIVGHAGTALLLGERPVGFLSTTVHIIDFYDLEHVVDRIGWWGFRAVASAGSLVNFAAAAMALVLLRWRRVTDPSLRYFLWLFASMSLFQQAFWLAIMPFAGLGGDWTAFFIGLEPSILWKSGVTAVGIVLLWLGIRLPLRLWAPALGDDPREQRRRMRRLTLLPVVAAFILQMASVMWSPLSGARHTTIVSVFSFIPFVPWLLALGLRRRWRAFDAPPATVGLPRSPVWLLLGLIACVLFAGVLGPGLGSFDGHPSFDG